MEMNEVNRRGGKPGNKNAKKEGAKASININIRTLPEVKKQYQLQAAREGLNLTDWIHLHLNGVLRRNRRKFPCLSFTSDE